MLTQVPEMFGAEQTLMNRAADEAVVRHIVAIVNDLKEALTARACDYAVGELKRGNL